jgi:serine/threonine-protein kinase
VHRDVKPANIVVLPFGLPKIMDFGIAKLDAGHHTTGQFLGTPLDMASEQALGQLVDGRTDVFSLGSVAYTLRTGRPPSRRRTCRAFWPASLTWSPRRVSELGPGT